MKTQIIAIIVTALFISAATTTTALANQEPSKNAAQEKGNKGSSLTLGREALIFEKQDSSIDIKLGKHKLSLLETLEGPELKMEKYDEAETVEAEHFYHRHDDFEYTPERKKFKGHWAGVEFGFNSYLTSEDSPSLPSEIDYMALHNSKSSCFNINFTQLSFGVTRRMGFTTGLGLHWNNYRFDGNNNIIKGENGVVEKLDPGTELRKSKLTTLFLTAPFMLELQIPASENTLVLAAGPIGAVKIGSHTKMVLEDGQKIKENGDFSLNMLRYGATARIGYENLQVFATYYAMPLFEDGKSPGGFDLYPFEIGLAFTFND